MFGCVDIFLEETTIWYVVNVAWVPLVFDIPSLCVVSNSLLIWEVSRDFLPDKVFFACPGGAGIAFSVTFG